MVQLLTQDAQQHDRTLCAGFRPGSDVSSFYNARSGGNQFVKVNAGQGTTWTDNRSETDSPHAAPTLRHVNGIGGSPSDGGTWSMDWGARDILMFKSAKPNSDWMPVENLRWDFSLEGEYQPAKDKQPFSLWLMSHRDPRPGWDQEFSALPTWSGAAHSPNTTNC